MFCPVHKIIFTHPPKCGGTSFEHFLGLQNDEVHRRLYKHSSLITQIQAIKKMNYDPKDFIKISIIRNPWDRMVSWYFYLKERAFLAEKTDDTKKRMQRLASNLEFNEFINYIDKFNTKIFHRDFSYYMFGESNVFEIDFVIKYENYEIDFLKCLEILKIPLISANAIPHKNIGLTRDLDYKKYYNEKSKEIVAKIYKEDIDFFKYAF